MIELQAVGKVYPDGKELFWALRGVELQVEAGEFLMVVGPSGSGKSTLLSVIGGLNPPDEGSTRIDDIPIYDLSQEQRAEFRGDYLGFVFQDFQLLTHLTVLENVLLPLTVSGWDRVRQRRKAEEALERVGLLGKARRLPNLLSGGERQRVAIARALVREAPIILADEPTGNLDSQTGWEVMELFRDLAREGATLIVVTHNPENFRFADRILYMRDGRVVK
ncbi:MAG: ABC transporter ATP-binding protein [Firmicutes bacterium]|nr:ABC transporter ATP-binding protein [Bacillota bacterium]MCL5039909.1 ABC transporter ATP-binding protein [Bacillota bacterium]